MLFFRNSPFFRYDCGWMFHLFYAVWPIEQLFRASLHREVRAFPASLMDWEGTDANIIVTRFFIDLMTVFT